MSYLPFKNNPDAPVVTSNISLVIDRDISQYSLTTTLDQTCQLLVGHGAKMKRKNWSQP